MFHRWSTGLRLTGLALIFSLFANSLVEPLDWTRLVSSDHGIGSSPVKYSYAVSSQSKNEPILLQIITRLIGDDWLGTDWLYIGLGKYRYPALDKNGQQLIVTDPVTGAKTLQWIFARFWTDPGPALLKTGDTLWVWGFDSEAHVFYADNIQVNPPARTAPPEDVSAFGSVLDITGQDITLQDPQGIRTRVILDPYTMYSFPAGEGLPRPQGGIWLHISWLTGSAGLLGRYNGFHGTYRGILRLDFSQP